MSLNNTKTKLENGDAVIGIVGMGYVGVPLALSYTAKSIKVVGFDVSPERVSSLQAGQSPLKHIPAEAIQDAREKSLLNVTGDFSEVSTCDAIILCVPTPLNKNNTPREATKDDSRKTTINVPTSAPIAAPVKTPATKQIAGSTPFFTSKAKI